MVVGLGRQARVRELVWARSRCLVRNRERRKVGILRRRDPWSNGTSAGPILSGGRQVSAQD